MENTEQTKLSGKGQSDHERRLHTQLSLEQEGWTAASVGEDVE